jgi:hypothetical protein
LSEWTIDTLKELLEARLDDMDEALKLQAVEYERRLEVLNNENHRIQEVLAKSVTSEKYDVQRQSDTVARNVALETMSGRVSFLERFQSRAGAYIAGAMLLSSSIGAIVGAIIVKVFFK